MQREILIDHDLENIPLQIKTDTAQGINTHLIVWFTTSGDEDIGGIWISFSDLRYFIWYCSGPNTGHYSSFHTAPPGEINKTWKITLERSSGIRILIHCNDVEVLDLVMSDTTCTNGAWKTYWSRDVGKMKFAINDGASDFYRPGHKHTLHQYIISILFYS